MDDETTLADLLALNLHDFEDEVRNIVDKATKELNMEKVLKELDATWSVMEFEHDSHIRTGTPLLCSSEELIETLEDNQVQTVNPKFTACNSQPTIYYRIYNIPLHLLPVVRMTNDH